MTGHRSALVYSAVLILAACQGRGDAERRDLVEAVREVFERDIELSQRVVDCGAHRETYLFCRNPSPEGAQSLVDAGGDPSCVCYIEHPSISLPLPNNRRATLLPALDSEVVGLLKRARDDESRRILREAMEVGDGAP